MTDPATPPSSATENFRSRMNMLEARLAPLFAKAPHLPPNVRETLVNVAPWVSLIVGVLAVFAAVSLLPLVFAVSSIAVPYAAAMPQGWYPMAIVALAILAVTAVLELLAFKPLSARKKKGWDLLFYGNCLSVVSWLVDLIQGSLTLGQLLGAVIGFWLLFEVREAYKS